MSSPLLIFIVGPPAVGKMAVGHELARRTGLKLFHNHHTIDLALRFFDFATHLFSGSSVNFAGVSSKRSPRASFRG